MKKGEGKAGLGNKGGEGKVGRGMPGKSMGERDGRGVTEGM